MTQLVKISVFSEKDKEHDKSGILERQVYHEIPPWVGYRLTNKGQ
ncbi:MAG: winged helix-turn-helix transcriptional regulator [Nitrososphaeraceae archaeon]